MGRAPRRIHVQLQLAGINRSRRSELTNQTTHILSNPQLPLRSPSSSPCSRHPIDITMSTQFESQSEPKPYLPMTYTVAAHTPTHFTFEFFFTLQRVVLVWELIQ